MFVRNTMTSIKYITFCVSLTFYGSMIFGEISVFDSDEEKLLFFNSVNHSVNNQPK